jgi:hypothetical protein
MFNPDDKPEFCIITPTAYRTYALESKTHLVLAHLVDTDIEYREFYASRSEQGDRIIMDNGAFELGASYEPDKLVSLGEQCGAHAIVLPDYPACPASYTINAAEKYIPLFKQAGVDTFFVPQSKVGDLEDWIAAYEWATENVDIDIIGMSILGIPNALPEIPASYARVVMAHILNDRSLIADKYHHFLGLNAGPALEIPALINMGILNSCDSSGPVWAGICGHEYSENYDSYQAVRKIKKHVDFNHPWTKDPNTHRIIKRNLELTLSLF